MLDKRMSLDDVIDQLEDGMTIAIGGWATRRKPMALVRAIARSSLKDLTIAAYGGPDVGLLAAEGRIAKMIFSFVSLDQFPLDPHFRAARQAGLAVEEYDEGMFQLAFRAGAMRVPFLPTRCGIGTDIIRQPIFRMVKSPFDDGEELVAVPAIRPDVTLLHVHRSDERGNILVNSPDPIFDEMMARAADRVFVTTEKIVPTAELDMVHNARFNLVERSVITGVVEAPFGAHPTSAEPDYQLDMRHLKGYVDAARTPEDWSAYRERFVAASPDDYLAAVGGTDTILAAKKPAY